jgi:hypothetical protein
MERKRGVERMNDKANDSYLRQRALRVVNDVDGNYTMLTRTLAIGVLDLQDERNRGRRIAEDRFDAELAELRDEILGCSSACTRRELELTTTIGMLAARVDGIARRVDSCEGFIVERHVSALETQEDNP